MARRRKVHIEDDPATPDIDESADVEVEEEVAADVPVLGEHILVDMSGSGVYEQLPAPEGWLAEKPRQLTINGQNVEHVDDHPTGVWCYRRM